MKSAVCVRSAGSRLFAGTQPADRLTVLSLVVSSACSAADGLRDRRPAGRPSAG